MSGDNFTLGTHIISYTVRDDAFNVVSNSFTIPSAGVKTASEDIITSNGKKIASGDMYLETVDGQTWAQESTFKTKLCRYEAVTGNPFAQGINNDVFSIYNDLPTIMSPDFLYDIGNGVISGMADQDITIIADFKTIGSTNISRMYYFRDVMDDVDVKSGTPGLFGGGSAQSSASVDVPAGTKFAYDVRSESSDGGQYLEKGSSICIVAEKTLKDAIENPPEMPLPTIVRTASEAFVADNGVAVEAEQSYVSMSNNTTWAQEALKTNDFKNPSPKEELSLELYETGCLLKPVKECDVVLEIPNNSEVTTKDLGFHLPDGTVLPVTLLIDRFSGSGPFIIKANGDIMYGSTIGFHNYTITIDSNSVGESFDEAVMGLLAKNSSMDQSVEFKHQDLVTLNGEPYEGVWSEGDSAFEYSKRAYNYFDTRTTVVNSESRIRIVLLTKPSAKKYTVTEATKGINSKVDEVAQKSEVLSTKVEEAVQESEVLSAKVEEVAQEAEVLSAKVEEVAQEAEVLNAKVEEVAQEAEVLSAKVEEVAQAATPTVEVADADFVSSNKEAVKEGDCYLKTGDSTFAAGTHSTLETATENTITSNDVSVQEGGHYIKFNDGKTFAPVDGCDFEIFSMTIENDFDPLDSGITRIPLDSMVISENEDENNGSIRYDEEKNTIEVNLFVDVTLSAHISLFGAAPGQEYYFINADSGLELEGSIRGITDSENTKDASVKINGSETVSIALACDATVGGELFSYGSGIGMKTFQTTCEVLESLTSSIRDSSARVVTLGNNGTSTNGVDMKEGDSVIQFNNGTTWAYAGSSGASIKTNNEKICTTNGALVKANDSYMELSDGTTWGFERNDGPKINYNPLNRSFWIAPTDRTLDNISFTMNSGVTTHIFTGIDLHDGLGQSYPATLTCIRQDLREGDIEIFVHKDGYLYFSGQSGNIRMKISIDKNAFGNAFAKATMILQPVYMSYTTITFLTSHPVVEYGYDTTQPGVKMSNSYIKNKLPYIGEWGNEAEDYYTYLGFNPKNDVEFIVSLDNGDIENIVLGVFLDPPSSPAPVTSDDAKSIIPVGPAVVVDDCVKIGAFVEKEEYILDNYEVMKYDNTSQNKLDPVPLSSIFGVNININISDQIDSEDWYLKDVSIMRNNPIVEDIDLKILINRSDESFGIESDVVRSAGSGLLKFTFDPDAKFKIRPGDVWVLDGAFSDANSEEFILVENDGSLNISDFEPAGAALPVTIDILINKPDIKKYNMYSTGRAEIKDGVVGDLSNENVSPEYTDYSSSVSKKELSTYMKDNRHYTRGEKRYVSETETGYWNNLPIENSSGTIDIADVNLLHGKLAPVFNVEFYQDGTILS
jgi:uncharacterized protein YoxC